MSGRVPSVPPPAGAGAPDEASTGRAGPVAAVAAAANQAGRREPAAGSREPLPGSPRGGRGAARRASLEELVPDCNQVGKFERFGDRDIVFVCDYCDGHIVWQDVRSMPASRTSPTPVADTGYPNWQATAQSLSAGEDKTVVFAPLVIANHLAAGGGTGWEARIWCPLLRWLHVL